MLRIQVKGRTAPPIPLAEKSFTIGSAADNHLVLSDASVDPLHARLISSGAQVTLRDNHSQNGSFVNGQRVTRKDLRPGDEIQLGSVTLQLLEAQEPAASGWCLVADSWLSGRTFSLPADRPAIIGRDASCDIVIAGTHLSRRHAELQIQGKQLKITDLGSVNGTYVNDQPIKEASAQSGDRLRIDVYSFLIQGPQPAAPPPPKPELSDSGLHQIVDGKPRRWKTRPTSPGNREEPTYSQKSLFSELWVWLILAAATLLFIGSVYFL